MADDNKKEDTKVTEEPKEEAVIAADKAKEAAEKAEESAEKAQEAEEKAQEVAKEVKEEVKEVKKTPPAGGADVKVSKKLEAIISDIEKLTVIELSELVGALEEKFGVTAQAPAAAAATAGTASGGNEGASEQTTFNVILADSGATKISVIKAVREIVPTLGLKEAKDLVDTAPKPVLEGANKEAANEAKTKLEAAGAKVELK